MVSRISPPLQFFKSRSGGECESPIYAQPFAHQHPQNIYHRRSEDYDTYVCRSIDEYDVTKSAQNVAKDQRDNISCKSEKGKINNIMGGSLHRNRKQHRRVRSIGDIDVIHVEAV